MWLYIYIHRGGYENSDTQFKDFPYDNNILYVSFQLQQFWEIVQSKKLNFFHHKTWANLIYMYMYVIHYPHSVRNNFDFKYNCMKNVKKQKLILILPKMFIDFLSSYWVVNIQDVAKNDVNISIIRLCWSYKLKKLRLVEA